MKNDRDTSNYNQTAKPGKNLSYSDCLAHMARWVEVVVVKDQIMNTFLSY